ncbi:MAG: hypothetical protein QXD61_08880 [Candidatus Caldarchaeum sp.]
MLVDWSKIDITTAEEQLERMRNGMPTTLPELYVLPSRARTYHDNFVKRMEKRLWGFILVVGENRAGKSAYLKYVERCAIDLGLCTVHIEVDDKQIRQLGANAYFNKQFFSSLRLFPASETFSYKLQVNERFRDSVNQLIENRRTDFEFYSPALTNALYYATSSGNYSERAWSWLRGEPQNVNVLRSLEIFDRNATSLLQVPTDKLIYFMKELMAGLDLPAILITVDEIERCGLLPPVKGRETLFMLRDLINIITSEESQPAKRGILNGVFLCFAISTFYLGYSGVIEVEGIDFRARADREGRPRVQIGDVPRLALLLRHSATRIDIELELQDLKEIAERVIGCYQRVTNRTVNINAEELARKAIDGTSSPLAGPNIQEMINILDRMKN